MCARERTKKSLKACDTYRGRCAKWWSIYCKCAHSTVQPLVSHRINVKNAFLHSVRSLTKAYLLSTTSNMFPIDLGQNKRSHKSTNCRCCVYSCECALIMHREILKSNVYFRCLKMWLRTENKEEAEINYDFLLQRQSQGALAFKWVTINRTSIYFHEIDIAPHRTDPFQADLCILLKSSVFFLLM